jgi:hypothetical protein
LFNTINNRSYLMTTKHTPGPWTYDKKDGSIGTKDGLTVTAGAYGYDIACSDADGVLMAAAPELLEVLEAIIADGLHCDVVPHLHEKARAAIAKATGEQ